MTNKRKQKRPSRSSSSGSAPIFNTDFQSYKIGPSMKERMGYSSDDSGWGSFIAIIVIIVAIIVGIIVSLSQK